MNLILATAEQAIQHSAITGEIARCTHTAANISALSNFSEDSAEGDELEFWGSEDADEGGRDWRVHVAR